MDDSHKPDTGDIERLVRASQSDDRGAFDELVRLYQGREMGEDVKIRREIFAQGGGKYEVLYEWRTLDD